MSLPTGIVTLACRCGIVATWTEAPLSHWLDELLARAGSTPTVTASKMALPMPADPSTSLFESEAFCSKRKSSFDRPCAAIMATRKCGFAQRSHLWPLTSSDERFAAGVWIRALFPPERARRLADAGEERSRLKC
jgi:hypothetical protein